MLSIPLNEQRPWQDSLADLITDPYELLELLELDAQQVQLSSAALREFPLRLPRVFAARMQKGNPHDPLLLQVLPQNDEETQSSGFSFAPLQEKSANPAPGILHKYSGRVLLMPTSSCAVHCRYCFRRHFPYAENRPDKQQWQENLQYIRDDTSIREIILSGGDPLAISDKHLEWLLEHLNGISHVERIRIHSRMPVVLPQRISARFCDLLQQYSMKFVIVIHSNHAQELDLEVRDACRRMKTAGAELLNQSVLLRNINDQVDALAELSETLFECGVLPYYLHLLDRVQGSAHFDVSEERGRQLMDELRQRLPGYLLPRLVREEPGESSKTLVF